MELASRLMLRMKEEDKEDVFGRRRRREPKVCSDGHLSFYKKALYGWKRMVTLMSLVTMGNLCELMLDKMSIIRTRKAQELLDRHRALTGQIAIPEGFSAKPTKKKIVNVPKAKGKALPRSKTVVATCQIENCEHKIMKDGGGSGSVESETKYWMTCQTCGGRWARVYGPDEGPQIQTAVHPILETPPRPALDMTPLWGTPVLTVERSPYGLPSSPSTWNQQLMQQVAATGSPTPSDWTMAMMSGDGSQAAAEAEMIPCFPDNSGVTPEFEQVTQVMEVFPHAAETLITKMYVDARAKYGRDHEAATKVILSQAADDAEAAMVMSVCNRLR